MLCKSIYWGINMQYAAFGHSQPAPQRELEELLSPLGIKVISLADIPDCPEIEEDG